MAITVLDRPQGVFLGDCFNATIDQDYAGKATVNTTVPHTLSDGDYVYITSDVENYNGFFPVDVIDGFHFFILQYPGGPSVPYVVNADIVYCEEEETHNWSCIHLPIVYRLLSDLFPVDLPGTTVLSFSDDNGYLKVTLAIGFLSQDELEWFVIEGAASDEVNGIHQIIGKDSSTVFTLNLAYDSSYSFTGASVRRYLANYNMIVKVYAGIAAPHEWESIKPFELAATLRLIPDSNNECKFSIHEILKSYVNLRNNTLLATLPNNTDFWCNFYISYAESYDTSDGYTITTHETSFTDDSSQFTGYAANAQLPFKNQYSGFLTEYVCTTPIVPGKWLTNFEQPVYFTGKYFDLSIIYDRSNQIRLFKDGVQISAYNYDQGVYRFPITSAGVYKIQALGSTLSEEITVVEDSECSNYDIYLTWLNHLGGFDYWKFTAGKEYIQNITETSETKTNILPNWPNSYGPDADTIRSQTYRESHQEILVQSQHVTLEQLLAIEQIKLSPLVQIVTSRADRRTVIVDANSFTSYKDEDKLFTISFTIEFTNNNPSQRR